MTDSILLAIASEMEVLGLSFDLKAFRSQTSIDLDQFAREIFFYGAEVFPEMIKRDVLETSVG